MRSPLLLAAAALMAALAAQAGDIYRWKEANGTWHYSDQPVEGAERVSSGKRVQTIERQAAGATTPAAAAQNAAAQPAAGKSTVERVREDVAAEKAGKCKDAQTNYEQTITSRRLYRQGPNGEQVFLTDDEIDAARVSARANMEYYCGK